MKPVFLLLFFCVDPLLGNAQLPLPAGDRKSHANNERLTGYYRNGNKQYEGYKRKENLHGQWNSWYSNGQPLDSGMLVKGIPDGTWLIYYNDGAVQFIRTYSSGKWQQFQNEKERYHPKRVSLPITKLYHDNKRQVEIYTIAINSFCAKQHCTRTAEELRQTIDNNGTQQHYHPIFENGLLHGPFINYFSDGAVKDSGNYKNGLPEGLWVKWTEDKQFYWKGYYQHGLKNKEWKLYSSNHKLLRILFINEGKYLWRKDMQEGVTITGSETSAPY